MHLQADMISGKLVVWLLQNFDTFSCSLPFVHGRMRVTKHDVHMTLGLPKGSLEVVESKNEGNASIEFASLLKGQKE